MSQNINNNNNNNNNNDESRSPGSSPFASPRSDIASSPRFEQFIRGMRIPNSDPIASLATAASPPRFVSIESFVEAARTAQNISLAHEISVNQNFKLEKLEYNQNSLEKQVKDTVHKVFWDKLKEDLNKIPPDYRHTFVILNEAKEGLLSLLLPNHSKLKEQIDQILDMELIQQQMNNETFDYHKYALFICDVMSKLCAPIRDDDIARIRTLTDPIDVFKSIMETLDLLKLDMANFTISQMRPQIQQQVVTYEQQKFKEFLELQKQAGIDGLEASKEWIKRAYIRIKDKKTIGDYKYESGPTASSIVNEAYMEIFVWTSDYIFPETLSMDELRFNEIYVKCRKFLVVCTIINAVYSLLGESVYGYDGLRVKLKENILILLDDFMNMSFEDLMKNIGEEVIKLANDSLNKLNKNNLDKTQEKCIKSLIIDLSSKPLIENTVYRVLFNRYIDFLHGILTKRTQGPVKIPQGMSIVEKDLIEITGQFIRLVSFNKTVFGTYYGEIIENTRNEDQ